jgi:hypothetical protein
VKKMSELLHQSCNIFGANLLIIDTKLSNFYWLKRKKKAMPMPINSLPAYNLEALVLLYFVACKHFSIK